MYRSSLSGILMSTPPHDNVTTTNVRHNNLCITKILSCTIFSIFQRKCSNTYLNMHFKITLYSLINTFFLTSQIVLNILFCIVITHQIMNMIIQFIYLIGIQFIHVMIICIFKLFCCLIGNETNLFFSNIFYNIQICILNKYIF